MEDQLLRLLTARQGHFQLESGHHGDLWLDLDPLFVRPQVLLPFADALATRLTQQPLDAVCGPLVGGAFLAQMVAAALAVEFYYTERSAPPSQEAMFSVQYRIPQALCNRLRGKAVAVVDDVINAGSAVRGTMADLQACGAQTVALGALLVLGEAAATFAASTGIPLVCLARRASGLWLPARCPLCAAGVPLEDVRPPAL